jgi:starch synthase (maltosyl-transferring)
MSSLKSYSGPARVVIDAVHPSLDGGAFPEKVIEGEPLRIQAHVIADAHDHIDVVAALRRVGDDGWSELPMVDLGNDEFEVRWHHLSAGLWELQVRAWIDRFRNWHIGFVKKSDAGDERIGIELEIGSQLVQEAAARANGKERELLLGWSDFLSDHSRDLMQKVRLARESAFFEHVRSHTDRSRESRSQCVLISVEPEKSVFSTWYEYFPRSCANDLSRHGTLRDAASRFAEIARMGFDIVYFPPIHPIGHIKRKGRNNALEAASDDVGSPWAIGSIDGGHKSIHPQLGTVDDFKWLVAEAEHYDLSIALDIAFQCAPDHPYVKEHPQWFKWRPDGSVQYAENPPKKYEDILPFDFETEDWEALWTELKSVFEYWIDLGVRVFRVDNPHTKPMEFWRWCIGELKLKAPDVIFLAEAFTRPKRKYRLAKAGFTQGYTYFTWRNTPADMRAYVEELTFGEPRHFFNANFWPNTPDILHEDLQKGTRATFIGRYLLAATLSGNVGIYGPAYELMESEPFPGKEEYTRNEKYEIKNWDWDRPGNIKPEISRINELRHRFRCLQRMHTVRFVEVDNPNFLAYLKQSQDRSEQLLVVVNFNWHTPEMGHVFLPMGEMGFGPDREYTVQDLFDPREPTYRWRGSRNFIRLDPRKTPAHVFWVNPT